jgi:hypothetical protein
LEKSDSRKNVELVLLLAAPALILLGIIYQTIYYSYFNIEITRYMEVSEIILSFANELLVILIMFFATFVFIAFLSQQPPNTANKVSEFKYIGRDLKLLIKSHLREFILFVAMLLFLIFAQLLPPGLILLGLIGAAVCIIVVARIHLQKPVFGYFKRKEFGIGKFIFDYAIILVAVVVLFAYAESMSVMNKDRYINSVIYFKSDTIRSNHFRFYIGQTNKYIFVYDLKKNVTSVYPMSDVTKLEFGVINYPVSEGAKK